MGREEKHLQETSLEDRVLAWVHTELNMQRYPLWNMRADKNDLEPKTYRATLDYGESGKAHRELTIIPSVELGPLGPVDQDVFTAVEEVLAKRGGMPEDGQLEVTQPELREILGWQRSGKANQRLRESLERIAMTSIRSRNAFYSKGTDSYVSDTFFIWSFHVMESQGDRGKASHYQLKFHPLFVNNFFARYLKGLDTGMYWALGSGIARRLYRLIDDLREGGLAWEVDIHELCERVPLRGQRYRSSILRKLAPAHQDLVSKGYLERVETNGDLVRYVVESTFARRYKARDMLEDPQHALALDLLLSLGVRGNTARDLVLGHGPETCMHYAQAVPYQTHVKSKSGWLVKAIEHGYELAENQLPPVPDGSHESQTLFSMDELDAIGSEPEGLESNVDTDGGAPDLEADPAAEEIWDKVLEDIAEEINAPSLRVWFEGTFATAVDEHSLTICVPNKFAREYIQSRFKEVIEKALANHLSPTSSLEIVVGAEGSIHNTGRKGGSEEQGPC